MATWTKRKFGDLITIKHGFAFKGEYFSDSPTNNILLIPGNFSIVYRCRVPVTFSGLT